MSDGTAAGTVLVQDIYPGTMPSSLSGLRNINGTLYFSADDGVHGTELWQSDGTALGTVMVKDIWTGGNSSDAGGVIDVNGTLFIVADDGTHGPELWKTDGTAAGTALVKDIVSGSSSSNPVSLTNVNGTLYFKANDGVNGTELWKSDGTESGTVLLKDICPGIVPGTANNIPASSSPAYLTVSNGTLYFTATDGVNGRELWKSDGTPEGTVMVKDIWPGSGGSEPYSLTNVNGTLYFQASDGFHGIELWRTDGTEAGTQIVRNINLSLGGGSVPFQYKTNIGQTLYFAPYDSTTGYELWKSDGTEAGTVLVKDIVAGSGSSTPQFLTNVNDTLYFVSTNSNGQELWKSDGTDDGTSLVKLIGSTGKGSVSAHSLTGVGDTLYFVATNPTNGQELWKSDGTDTGTLLVEDIVSGSGSSNPQSLTGVGDSLYFVATNSTNGQELWKSDDTGTSLVNDILAGSDSSNPQSLTNVNGTLYFTADDGENGRELWKSDGTGTAMVTDIYPEGSAQPYALTNVNGILYFVAEDYDNGVELWKSDGTETGTILVKNIAPDDTGSGLQSLTNVNCTLYFTANDGANGTELWKSDGTEAGTVLVKDITSGSGSSNLSELTNVNGTLYFRVQDPSTNNYQLWQSDGTAAGTVPADPSGATSLVNGLYNADGNLFFSAFDGNSQSLGIWMVPGAAANPNHAPTGSPTAILSAGTEDTTYVLQASDLLAGFSDVDEDTLSVSALAANHGTIAANGEDSWLFTPTPNYNGLVSFTYDVTDGKGGATTASLPLTINPVNDAPTGAVVVTGTAIQGQPLSANTGSIADVDGLGPFNYQWQATPNGSNLWTVISGATNDSFTPGNDLIGQQLRVLVSYTDGQGTAENLTSTPTDPVNSSVDTTAPDAPTISQVTDDVYPVTGILKYVRSTNDSTPTVRVSLTDTGAQAGEHVQLFNGTTALDGVVSLTNDDISNGYKDITPSALVDGDYALNAKITDAAGNVSSASSNYNITIDTLAPTGTVSIISVEDNQLPVIGLIENGGSTNDATPTVKVELSEPGAQVGDSVQLYEGTTALGRPVTLIPGALSVSITPPALSEGIHDFNVRIVDEAGNVGSPSANYTVTLDHTPPAMPTITQVVDDVSPLTGPIARGGATNDATPMVRVSLSDTGAVAGDSVQLFNMNNVALGDAVSLTNEDITEGFKDITPSVLTDGSYVFTAKITDATGNVSTPGFHPPSDTSFPVTIDTQAPSARITLDPITADNIINASEAGLTFVPITFTVTKSESRQPGDTVTLTVDGTDYTSSGWSWEIGGHGMKYIPVPGSALEADGDLTVEARFTAVDAAGNSTTATAIQTYSVDITAPTMSTISQITDDVAPVTGAVSSGGSTNDTTLTLTGTAESGSTVTIFDGETAVGTGMATDDTFTITTSVLSEGARTLTAKATDLAGNMSVASTAFNVNVNTSAPLAGITVNSVTADNVINAAEAGGTVTLTGTVGGDAKVGDTVTLTVNGHDTMGAVVDLEGGVLGYSIAVIGSDLAADTLIHARVAVTDAAGNSTTATADHAYTVDTTAPVVAITAIADDTGTPGDFITSDTSLTVSGTNDALGTGGKVQVSGDGGSTWADASVSGTIWSYVDPVTHSSDFTYQARVVDGAGNIGNTANQAITLYAGMVTFTGTAGNDIADASAGTLIGFTGGSVAELQDNTGDTFNPLTGADTIVAGSGNDIINSGVNDANVLDSFDGGAGIDTLNFKGGDGAGLPMESAVLTNIENLTSGDGSQTIVLSPTQFASFSTIDMGNGNADQLVVPVAGNWDISMLPTPTINNVEFGYFLGSQGDDSITLTGAQFDAILIGNENFTLGPGTDTLNLTSTSSDLNTLGETDGLISGVEVISAATAAAGVTLNLSGQSEAFTITGSAYADTISAGSGDDTINGFAGADTVGGGGGVDTIRLRLTSADLNSATDQQVTDVEAVTAAAATAGVTLDLHNQQESYTITGSSFDDTITGGGGSEDTVIFSGNRADYTITLNGSTYTIVDTRPGSPNGTDAVTDVENFQFAGGTTFTTGAGGTLDITSPAVTSVAYGTNDGTLKAGEAVTLAVTFSENVTVAGGTPSLLLDTGGTATLTGGSGTNQLSFTYTVAGGQNSADLEVSAFNLNGATVKDAQGNDADTTGAVTNPDGILVVDTMPLNAPTISQVTDDVSPVMRTVASGGSTNDNTPTVRVSLSDTGASAGNSVQLFNGTTALGAAVTLTSSDITAGFTEITPSALSDGSYAFNAKITDTVGNTSAPSTVFNVTVDTAAPTALVSITAIADDTGTPGDFTTSDTSLTVSGTNGALGGGEKVQVSSDGGSTWADAIVSTTTWSYVDPVTHSSNFTYQARVVDGAGNIGNTANQAIILSTSGLIINGTSGADFLVGTNGDDTINGLGGDDTINGFVGADRVNGGAGNDTIVLTATSTDLNTATNTQIVNVEVVSAAGAATGVIINLHNQTENLTIIGSGNNDTITGNTGNNTINAGGGDDTIVGFVGTDRIDGEGGTDMIVLTATSAALNSANNRSIVNIEAVSAASAGSGVIIDVSNQNEGFMITGSTFGDTIIGGDGNDAVLGFVGMDRIDGGGGTDMIVLTTTSADLNSAGNFRIVNVEAVSAASAESGVTIDLSNQNEGFRITGSAFGDTITGSKGDDDIRGGNANDILNGGNGADRITGGNGVDAIDLGFDNKADHVVFNILSEFGDTISNFDIAHDSIDFGAALKSLLDDGFNRGDIAWGTSATGNNSNTAVNLNNLEALYEAGTANDGVLVGNLTNSSAVATEFNAEFNISVTNGESTLLVINDNTADSNQTAVWLYTEAGGAEIQGNELQLIGMVNANGSMTPNDFHFV